MGRRGFLEMSPDELDAARDWVLLLWCKTARKRAAMFRALVLRRASVQAEPLWAELPRGCDGIAACPGRTIVTTGHQITDPRRDDGIEVKADRRDLFCADFAALLVGAGDDGAASCIDR